ncbi:MAG: FHA domain-containing protein [Acidobacteria bacterium]|nr:FHA domain-containing protein [Acidobacteriota bacterium]
MPAARISRLVTVTVLGLALGVSASASAAEPGVLLAIDSSRSLTPEQNAGAVAAARELYVRLAAEGRPAVLAFDDEVRWLARAGEPGGEDAISALRPTGRFTVLHDGLVEGVRALHDGGVLVLVSDGKDENSATTIEDVARLATDAGVRVVTLGAGRVDERTLRRLALLTGGLYGGAVGQIDPDALAAEVGALRRSVAAERTAAEPTPPPTTPMPVSTPAPAVEREPDGSRFLLLLGGLLAAVGILVGFLLARRRATGGAASPLETESDQGTRPGVPLPEPTSASPAVEPVDEIQAARLRGRPQVPPNGLIEVSLDDTAAFRRLPFSESIERTLVLTEELVLSVREPGREPRYLRIPPDRAIDVGRDSKRNTLAFQDPTMSVQHFRLVLEEGELFLVDQGSTNGVVVQERRVDSARLRPGDRFRAGMIEFQVHVHHASVA